MLSKFLAKSAAALALGLGGTGAMAQDINFGIISTESTQNLKADWAAIGKSANEVLVNSLALMSPYGAEEKQALLEAADLKTRAEVLVALAEMELASSNRGGTGSTLQ